MSAVSAATGDAGRASPLPPPGGRARQPYLRRRNPTVKFTVVLVLSLLLTVVLDPWTPLLLLGITLIAGLWLGRLPLRTYGGALLPLLLIGLGFVWSNALFSAYPDEAGVLARLGPLRVSTPGLVFGTALAVRGLAIGVLSVTFILTTDPTDLIVSLIRHARLPYRLGYPLLAAYRFLPFFRQEYRQIALARRVRGVLEQGFIWQRLWRRAGYIVPLLSSAVRRAAHIAIAMDSRAFAAATSRTYYRMVPLTLADGLFAAAAVGVGLAIVGASGYFGWLRLWDGRFIA